MSWVKVVLGLLLLLVLGGKLIGDAISGLTT
jgi:hypothetical protein